METIASVFRAGGKRIGFVPTMGFLHEGHLSLIRRAKENNDVVVCSIFVNPTQFNNAEDFELYPRNETADFALLESVKCDIVFAPENDFVNEIMNVNIDLKGIDNLLEGKFRPGHFKGVVNIVSLLFEKVKPNKAYFGQKDFQQLAIVKELAKQKFPEIEIVACATLREQDGLAMSSRNARLSEEQKQLSLNISAALRFIEEKSIQEKEVNTLKKLAIEKFFNSGLDLEYLEVIDSETLQTIDVISHKTVVVCVAAFAGKVRLIDNIIINY